MTGLLRNCLAIPLQLTLMLLKRGRRGYTALKSKERAEAIRLLRRSRGWPGNLNARQRRRLRKLVTKAARASGQQDDER